MAASAFLSVLIATSSTYRGAGIIWHAASKPRLDSAMQANASATHDDASVAKASPYLENQAVVRTIDNGIPTSKPHSLISDVYVNHNKHLARQKQRAFAIASFAGQTAEVADFDQQSTFWKVSGDHAVYIIKLVFAPAAGILFGACALCFERSRLAGMLAMFFGAQVFMNLYMKCIISEAPVSEVRKWYGFPAPFLVTVIQLVTSFVLLLLGILVSWLTPYPYTPKPLGKDDVPAICGLALTFAANISLNNMSLTMIDVSVNQVIRAGGPIAIIIVSALQAAITRMPMQMYQKMSYVFLLGAVFFAAFTMALKSTSAETEQTSPALFMGSFICFCSNLASASNMLVVHFVGRGLKLNPMDSIFYMAIPAALLLLIPACVLQHPVPWSSTGNMTDIHILKEILSLRPLLFGLGCLSGVFALAYNLLMYNICQALSAMTIEMVSNFNKAATIGLAIVIGMEKLPAQNPYLLVYCIIGNLACICMFGVTEARARSAEEPVKLKNGKV
eukprot:TRINITY_DN11138_c0_g2_i1.p1 TRINITY_DN11138_c0_g2~~TRINITY_DN11138_c0_g2_i1.p1  ORF type:complete len:504 (+),score=76.91 TRINITY_DN11138_c0_g2_i1:55-1566(+)